jgi:hypothetical protein
MCGVKHRCLASVAMYFYPQQINKGANGMFKLAMIPTGSVYLQILAKWLAVVNRVPNFWVP